MPGPLPLVPNNFLVQSGNGQVYLSWSPVVGSSGYNILRSTDQVNFSVITATTGYQYYDSTASTGVQYFYQIQAFNGNGTSYPTSQQAITCVTYGQVSLGFVREAAKQRADMIDSDFVTNQEWNSYINHSYNELYDLLVSVYGDDYFAAPPHDFHTDGRVPSLYPLPEKFYKMLGVDLTINASSNGYLTMKKFNFANRNQWIYGNTPVSYYGYVNLKYRILGSNIEFIPQPTSNQIIRLWYVPRPATLLADNDILDGISGWDEYVIVDAAIKALQKEESDVTVLMAQKEMLKRRIEGMAANRDLGMPESVTDVRSITGYGDVFGGGPIGGF